jgi:hypothetical protein
MVEHFPEKCLPSGLTRGWRPVFRRKCDQLKKLEHVPLIPIQNSAVIAGLDPAIHPLKRNAA